MSFAIKPMDPVNDFTAQVGGDVVKVLADQPKKSYADVLQDAFSTFNKLRQEEKVDNAIAYYDKELNKGRKVADILREIDPNIAGSDDFREPAHKINENYRQDRANARAEAQLAEQFRQTKLKEEANKIALDLDLYARQVGAENAYMWMDKAQNRAKLLSNPYAYDLVSKIAASQGFNLKPALTSTTPATLSITNPDKVIDIMNKLRTRQGELRSLGINANMSDEEAMSLTSLQGFIDHGAKQRGYEKDDGAYSDYSENMTKAFNQLRSANPNVPIEAILMSMKLNQDNGGFFWFDQPDINISSANDHLSKVGKTWASNVNEAHQIKKHLTTLEKAYNDGTIANNIAAIKTQATKLKALVDRGLMSEQEAQTSLNQYAAAIETNNQALKEALTVGNIFGKTVPNS